MRKNGHIVGLDIGTSSIRALVGRALPDGSIDILGVGHNASTGLRKGVVVNLEHTIRSIGKAVDEAEELTGVKIHSVFAGIAGGHVEGINSRGMVGVSRKDREITKDDVDRAIVAAKAVKLPVDREALHVIPQDYIVDNQDGIKDPVGMMGVRLEARVHLVTGSITSAQNVVKCVRRAGIEVEDIVLEPLAASQAVLTEEERALGVVLLDLGAGTTDILVLVDGAVRHSKVLGVGGEHVTNDLAYGLRTPKNRAEELKKAYGAAMTSLVNPNERINVPSFGHQTERSIPRRELVEFVEPRMEEILTLSRAELERSGFGELIPAGIVMTGGAALLPGTEELARKIFQCPVRQGVPRLADASEFDVSSPIFATGVGLVSYGLRARAECRNHDGGGGFCSRTTRKVVDWMSRYF